MQIEEAKKGLKYDVYSLKNFLTDTEKEIWQEAIETVLNELEKKDKVIDEMVEIISNVTVPQEKCKECIKEYFYKKVSDNK